MSDVYSFGVLLAFLFTGKHATSVPRDVQVWQCAVLAMRRMMAACCRWMFDQLVVGQHPSLYSDATCRGGRTVT
jgi:hypothetical protein